MLQIGGSEWRTNTVTGKTYTTLTGLTPDTRYEVMVQARNAKGYSDEPASPQVFYTPDGTGERWLQSGWLILATHYTVL